MSSENTEKLMNSDKMYLHLEIDFHKRFRASRSMNIMQDGRNAIGFLLQFTIERLYWFS